MSSLTDKIPVGTEPLVVAVIHPTDKASLTGPFMAASKGLIKPILVGPEDLIKKAAENAGIDISGLEIVPTADDKEAAAKGVELVNKGRAEALMKGLISTGTFLKPIVSGEDNLRTDRRMSHIFRITDPDSYTKPLYISDAAVNAVQDVKVKKHITQNAIDAFRAIEGHEPKVALLSATEKASEAFENSMIAKEIKEMAARGEITGGIVDGPFAFDNAVSKKAADIKGIESDVAGDADITIVPSLEAGNILYKALCYWDNAERAGIVVGAKVPVILTSRSADVDTRVNSCAMALLHTRNQNGTS